MFKLPTVVEKITDYPNNKETGANNMLQYVVLFTKITHKDRKKIHVMSRQTQAWNVVIINDLNKSAIHVHNTTVTTTVAITYKRLAYLRHLYTPINQTINQIVVDNLDVKVQWNNL